MTTKRNGVPTLRAAAEAVVDAQPGDWGVASVGGIDVPERVFDSLMDKIDVLRLALRTDRDLSARRTRRRRGTNVWAPVTPVNTRPRG